MIEEDIQSEKLKALGSFAGGIAHDLNNLLMAVLGHISFLKMEEGELSRDSLEAAETGIKRAAKLTQQILDFTRKELDYDNSSCDICELVKSSIPIFSPSLPENINLGLRLQEQKINVAADESQLTQVILNLLVNAKDAMPNGGKISIGIEKIGLDKSHEINGFILVPNNYCKISVSDQGHGMSANIQSQIFDPFFTTKRGTGTGIGLATVFFIVKSLRGAIDVVSELNAGTTFDVYLPLCEKKEVSGDFSKLKKSESINSAIKKSSSKHKILVVDDEDSVRLVLQKSLEVLGYEVVAAENGPVALEYFKIDPSSFSLVIMDMIMPLMPGDELFFNLKELREDVKILISSGYASDGKTQELLRNGACGFMQKPFAIDELASEVSIILGN